MHDELTAVDIKKMKEEIEYRKSVLTPKLKEDVRKARELGDLSENDEYRSAKRELNSNYSRIRYLTGMIDTAIVIEDSSDDDTVGLFDHITFAYEDDGTEETVTIVTTLRTDALHRYISKESPMGKALLGKKVGDRVLIRVNDTVSYYVVIKSFEKGEDDESIEIRKY